MKATVLVNSAIATAMMIGLVAKAGPVVTEVTPSDAAPAQDVAPFVEFFFGAGVHTLTGETMILAQQDLKAALGIGGAFDPDDLLVFADHLNLGTDVFWWVGGQQLTVTGVFERREAVSENGFTMSLLDVDIESGEYTTQAYLLVTYNATEGVGAAVPITAESWDAFHRGDAGRGGRAGLTCAEKAVEWCNEWYPPCSPYDNQGGIVGCFQAAACRAANCHNLSCIPNAYDCCEAGKTKESCEWRQWWNGGDNLEHVTCDTVHTIEKGLCVPWVAIKSLLS